MNTYDTEILAHGFSLFLIITYSIRYFNQPLYNYFERDIRYKGLVDPIEPRLLAEYTAYRFYRAIFIGVIIVLYIILFVAFSKVSSFEGLSAINQYIANFLKNNKSIAILANAFIVIGITHYPKWVADIISELRSILHEQARVPLKGREIFEKLLHTQINYNLNYPNHLITKLLSHNPINESESRKDVELIDFKIKNRKDVVWKWAKLSYLITCINDYLKSDVLRKHEGEYKHYWQCIWSEYLELIDDVIEYKEKKDQLSKDEINVLREEVCKLLYKTCRLIACYLLLTARPEVNPTFWLAKYGYDIKVDERKWFQLKSIFYVAGIVALSITTFSFAAGYIYKTVFFESVSIGTDELIKYNIYAGLIMIIPLFFVVLLKRYLSVVGVWPAVLTKQDEKPLSERPWLIYIFISSVSWLLANVLASGYKYYFDNPGYSLTLANISHEFWSITFVAFVTVMFAAYRLDIPPLVFKSSLRLYFRYILFALFQGTVTALVVYFALWLSNSSLMTDDLYRMYFYCLLGFVAGASMNVGFQFGRHTYEKAASRKKDVYKDTYHVETSPGLTH